MFTGIVEERARVAALRDSPPGLALTVEAVTTLPGLRVGDSIAVNGACLTAEEVAAGSFTAQVVPETLSRTNLGGLSAGCYVNLERPLRADSRWEGHIVQGHVDAAAPVVSVKRDDEGRRMAVLIPGPLAPYVAEKGSIAWDGVSLTVAGIADRAAEAALIPHTVRNTVLGDRREGDLVNVEVDVLAKYTARLLERGRTGEGR